MTIKQGSRFKSAYKKISKSGNMPSDFKENLTVVLKYLKTDKPLPIKYQDHPLKGNFKGYRDCHICPDYVLIYSSGGSEIILANLVSHSDFINKRNPMQN